MDGQLDRREQDRNRERVLIIMEISIPILGKAYDNREIVAVIGSRPPSWERLNEMGDDEQKRWSNAEQIVFREVRALRRTDIVVSGGASGVDTWAKRSCYANGIDYIEIPALWDFYKKSAGFRRNPLIIGLAQRAIAFWDGQSNGTKQAIDSCERQEIPVTIVQI
jgi:predicted Rossmann fold nucleotide-binding protein DprA/Smf involved in DNA uptake